MIPKDAFLKMRKEREAYDASREIVIKTSRDILKNSKAAIYAIHRGEVKDAQSKLELAQKITKKQLDSIKKYSYWIVVPSRNRKYRAKLVGSIDDVDIAMLQVENIDQSEYSTVKIGDPNKIKIGDRDWAIGNPNNLANSLTSGVVSSLHRNINKHFIDDFI